MELKTVICNVKKSWNPVSAMIFPNGILTCCCDNDCCMEDSHIFVYFVRKKLAVLMLSYTSLCLQTHAEIKPIINSRM